MSSNSIFISYRHYDVEYSKDRQNRLALYINWLDTMAVFWFEPDLLAYKDDLCKSAKLKPSTVYSRIAAVRSQYSDILKDSHLEEFLQTVHQELYGHTEGVPKCIAKMKIAADPRKTKFSFTTSPRYYLPLTTYQVGKLINTPDTLTLLGLRNLAIIALPIYVGLRGTEIPLLTVNDLYLTGEEGEIGIHVPEGPTSTERFVPFHPTFPIKSILKAWVAQSGIREGPVFRGFFRDKRHMRDNPITLQAIEDVFRLYPIYDHEKPVYVKPFDLRLFYARMLYALHYSLDDISQYLGVQPQTTLNYVSVPLKSAEKIPVFDITKLQDISNSLVEE